LSTRSRRQRSSWLLAAYVLGSAAAQIGALGVVHLAFPPPPPPDPRLTIGFEGTGAGTITIADANLLCDSECGASFAEGTTVTVVAKPAEGSYLDGWSDECTEGEPFTQCTVTIDGSRELFVFFEKVSDDVDVEWLAEDTDPDDPIKPPDPEIAQLPDQVAPPRPPEADQPVELTLPPPPVVAQLQPTPPPAPEPPPEEKKEEEAEAQKQPEQKYTMKSVEVTDENLVEEAPEDAQFLSDKNRDVAEQTIAKDTNLERQQEGKQAYSEKSDVKDTDEVGAEEAEIAELEDSEADDLDTEDAPETDKSGEDEVAQGILRGDEGDGGDEGEGGDGRPSKEPGVMSMRGVTARGAPGGPVLPQPSEKRGSGGRRGKVGKTGKKGIKTDISFDDYERIVGKDKAQSEVKIAQRKKSKKKGRWRRQRERVMSSLENFVPEVQPGNQTALKTRAEPFAIYIARMHRRIHELWGFGYIAELDAKPRSSELNNQKLMTKLELVINPDGTIDKATVVQHSGVTQFDVAALDVAFTAEPYEPTPKDIRSPDGKVYLHWRFHRDWRQCGTFGVEKFILDKAPADNPQSGLLSNENLRRRKKKGDKGRAGQAPVAGGGGDPAAAARANANLPSPDDPRAEATAIGWVNAFEGGSVTGMINQSSAPFTSGGNVVAANKGALSAVYGTIMRETRTRKVTDWKVLSPAQYRKRFGPLPAGVDANYLLLVVKVPGDRFTLLMKPGADGGYAVTGFER